MLTVYGIETPLSYYYDKNGLQKLQQCLPFTVLKQVMLNKLQSSTQSCNSAYRLRYWNPPIPLINPPPTKLQQCLPFTVLKRMVQIPIRHPIVATVLTVYGIETTEPLMMVIRHTSCNSAYRLRYWNFLYFLTSIDALRVATVLTVYGIETNLSFGTTRRFPFRCNSAYRLRYWNTMVISTKMIFNFSRLQQCLPFTVLKLSFINCFAASKP